jgi:hypothetical protein
VIASGTIRSLAVLAVGLTACTGPIGTPAYVTPAAARLDPKAFVRILDNNVGKPWYDAIASLNALDFTCGKARHPSLPTYGCSRRNTGPDYPALSTCSGSEMLNVSLFTSADGKTLDAYRVFESCYAEYGS